MGIFTTSITDPGLVAGRMAGTQSNNDNKPLWDSGTEVDSPYGRSDGARYVDNALNIVESDGFNYGVMTAGLGYAAYTGGAAAAAGGTSVAGGALLAAAPIAVGAVAGIVGGMAGAYVGDKLGHAVMSNIPGFTRLPEAGEMPATMGMPIAHTSPWATLGALALGAVAAVAVGAFIVATGGTGLLVIAAAGLAAGAVAGLGAGFASAAGQYGTNKGIISKGSMNVMFNNKPVARVTDLVACSVHKVSAVAQGAETVFANNLPIARIGNKTACNGVINDGCTDIAIDIDTSAFAIDIDGGWLERGTRIGLAVLNFLPIPSGNKNARRAADVDGPPRACTTGCGDPVDVASGQLIDTRTDFYIPGTIPLHLTRTYDRKATGLLGRGWASTWGRHLRVEGAKTIYQDPEGVDITFHTPDDVINSANVRMPHLEMMGRKGRDVFILDRREQLIYSFGRYDGDRVLLTAIEDRNENRITFHYDSHGLKEIRHSDGFAADVMSKDDVMQMVALRDHPDGDCVVQWDYSSAGRLVVAQSAQMGTLKYSYDDKGRITRWADNKDTEVFYEYDHSNRIVRSWSTSGHMGVLLDHHPEERFTVVTDSVGNQSTFHYDADGLVVREVDALGGEWLTEWDNRFNVTKRVNPLGAVSTYTFDTSGNMTAAEDPTGAKLAWEYDAAGLLVSRTDAGGAVETFTYDDNGNIKKITDADGGVVGFRRGKKGEVLRVELPGGGQERVYYDHLMRPRMQITADGHETKMRYDVEGRLTMIEDGEGHVTRYTVARSPTNPRGAVTEVILPNGATTQMGWDNEGQLATMTDGEGQTRHFAYGAFDLPITATDAAGGKMTLEHDREMRLTAVVNALGERYEYSYDPVGALVAERDFSGLVTRYIRDIASRVTKKIAPDGVETDYAYSDRGDLIEMRVGDAITRFDYDPRGLLTLAENKDAKVEYAYDALGRVISEKLDGREVLSEYGQSTAERTKRSGDILPLEAGYSRGGLMHSLRVAGHDALSFQHDRRGLEVLRKTGTGFAMAQGYTANAELKAQVAGHIDQLPDDARQGMMSISTRYDPGYGASARTYRSYDWDKAGRAVGINDAKWGTTRFAYDPRGQVGATQHVDKSGYEVARSQFAYDATRNIAGVQTAQGQEQVKQSAGGRVLARGRAFYRHDACGRVIEKRLEEPGFRPKTWQMEWDGEGRLVRLTTPEGAVWGYGYDALGRRVRRLKLVAGAKEETDAPGYQGPGTGKAYQWDGDQIAAEAPVYADGTVAWDQAEAWIYEPGSFRPMAKVVGEELYHVVTDHIGTPRELVSADGQKTVWRARVGLWGDIAEQARVAANDDHPPVTCDIRFQGQWYDEESGLHYNRFRYYDPEATQYLSPDPIGLMGGTRPQGYAANPNHLVDPYGLAVCQRRYQRYRDLRSKGFSAQDAARYSKPYANPKNRPGYGRDQVDTVWSNAQDANGRVFDPNTGQELYWDRSQSRAGQWDMGHRTGHEYRDLHRRYIDGEISKTQFLDEYRNADNYYPEDPSSNRSHAHEADW